jgi:predicted O-linked N-acetylglucosamine transferase (SPINDLY family)
MTAGSQSRFEQGFALHQKGRLAEAEELYEQVLREQPTHADAAHLHGLVALQSGRLAEGVERLRAVVVGHPSHATALHNLGLALCQLGEFADALAHFDRVLVLRPEHAGLHADRGNALAALGRHEAAAESLRRAVALAPDNAEAHNNLGVTLNDLERREEALSCFATATRLHPRYAEAHANRAGVLHQLGRDDEALDGYNRALALKPGYAEAHYNRGTVLAALRRSEEALASYDRALALQPGYGLAHVNRANLLAFLGQHEEALAGYDRALALDPRMAPVHGNRGDSLAALGRLAESAAAYDQAFRLDPYCPYAIGNALHARQHLCDWGRLETLKAKLDRLDLDRRVLRPFIAQTILDDPAKLLACTAAYAAAEFPGHVPLMRGRPSSSGRIRLAYVSGDFHDHPVMRLIAEVFERHDRSVFDIRAISFGPATDDPLRRRLEGSFDSFHDCRGDSDQQIARSIAGWETDIAVDLMGYTSGSRPGIFSHRPAPVQATYLGYPGTLGSPYFDYLIADPVIAPKKHQPFYAEQLVQLPDSYFASAGRPVPDSTPARAEFGLPQRGFVFCCFNHTYKITPSLFEVWTGLLRAVEGSVLWLFGSNKDAEANLRREAQARGVAPERLVFTARVDSQLYLPRFRAADLFLDTLPYNAHSTAADALWAGLPVLTCRGAAFPGRVAASLLRSVGLPDLVTTSLADYEALALRLAQAPDELGALRTLLEAGRASAPLFDAQRFTRHLESAYRTMHKRRLRGLPPEGFSVSG